MRIHSADGVGCVIFDNSAVKRIAYLGVAADVASSLRAVGLTPFASEALLVEASAATPARARKQIDALRALAGEYCVLPWVMPILQGTAQGYLEGNPETEFFVRPLSIAEPDEDFSRRREECRAFASAVDDAAHARNAAQRADRIEFIRSASGRRYRLADLPHVLDVWPHSESGQATLRDLWHTAELPGEAPMQIIDAFDVWKLALEAVACSTFLGQIIDRPFGRVGLMDLLQLVYLGGAVRRVLVTDDQNFATVAKLALHGRHAGARVQLVDEFLRSSGVR